MFPIRIPVSTDGGLPVDDRVPPAADRPNDDDRTLDASTPAAGRHHSTDSPGDDTPGDIGPYHLLRRLGEGGMGEVFLARQTKPIERIVALKVIKAGMDTHAVVNRFEQERQTLALMDHPGIARVYDAGQTPGGRPYFVMEYVDGAPITHYCNARRLSLRQRLQLVIDVCAAVQHAHQKAVIHRDLKPGNILVTEVDGRPVPKVIDFGIARATDQRDVERTVFTQLGHAIGTPAYMSPEQADPTNTDIDTRTDIYSLGVVLYELLVGRPPFDVQAIYSQGYEAVMRFVREQEAPRPSIMLQQYPATTTEIAAYQGTEPGRLARTLKGDLDWILLKALDKDRARRYETANALAMDLRRYLGHESVLASPPSAAYRARKFVRRHRHGVGAGATALVVLLAFAVTTTLQNGVIARERDRAELERAKAGAINDFLRGMLVGVDPWASGDTDLTVVQAMDAARAGIDSTFAQQPLVAAEMHAAMGQTYLGLQKVEAAEQEVRRGLELHTQQLGPDAPELDAGWLALANIQRLNSNLPDAIGAAREVVRLRELNQPAGSAGIVESYLSLGEMNAADGRYDAADSAFAHADELIASSPHDLRRQRANELNLRGWVVQSRGQDLAAADSLYRLAVDIQKESEPGSPKVSVYLNDLAVNQMIRGDFDAARATYDESLELTRARFGVDHPEYALVLENLGGIAYRQGDFEKCLANLETVYAIRAANLGDDHPLVMRTRLNMGAVALGTGKSGEAVAVFEELLPRLIALKGETSQDAAATLRNLGMAYQQSGRYAEARAAFDRSRAAYTVLYPDGNEMLGRLDLNMASALLDEGRPAEAEGHALRGLETFSLDLDVSDVRVANAKGLLVKIYEAMGRPQEAERYR
jgi:serine/threonine protein kinase/tetratricopeptide (TPR) repeat protein